jgi:predicted transcriptional regulator
MKQLKQKSPSGKRDRLAILAEILEIALYGAKKTQIIYQANLSFKRTQRYLRLMEQTKLITKIFGTKGMIYKTTQKGVAFMIRYLELKFMLQNPKQTPRQKTRFYPTTA